MKKFYKKIIAKLFWKPVTKNGLPKKNGLYICVDNKDTIITASFFNEQFHSEYDENNKLVDCTPEIVAWRKLPRTYGIIK